MTNHKGCARPAKDSRPLRVAACVRQAIRWALMFKRPGFRFSLLTLLLVTTLAALSVSHWRMSGELAKAEQMRKLAQEEARRQRQTIRALNDDLGLLTVDDESQVHVIAQSAFRSAPFPRQLHAPWQSSFGWRAYLPATSHWRICWTIGEIPLSGIPTSMTGQHMLRETPDGTTTFAVVHLASSESGLVLVSGSMRDATPAVIDLASWTAVFGAEDEVRAEMAGNARRGSPGTESFAPSGPVVLLRQWRVTSSEQMATQTGIVLWLEPVAKKPAVPTSARTTSPSPSPQP
jgi:hypothetical protein